MSKTVLGLLVYMKLKEQRQDASIRAIDWVTAGAAAAMAAGVGTDSRGAMTLADLIFMRDGLSTARATRPGAPCRGCSGASTMRRPCRQCTGRSAAGAAVPLPERDGQHPLPPAARPVRVGPRLLALSARRALRSDRRAVRRSRSGPFRHLHRVLVPVGDAADWARIGEVLRRDGMAGGPARLPAGWQRFAGTPPPPAIRLPGPTAPMSGSPAWPTAPPAGRTTGCRPTPSCCRATGAS